MTLWKWRLLSFVAALMAGLWAGFFSVYEPFTGQEIAVAALIVASITYAAMHLISLGGAHAMARWRPWITAFVVLTTAIVLLLIRSPLNRHGLRHA